MSRIPTTPREAAARQHSSSQRSRVRGETWASRIWAVKESASVRKPGRSDIPRRSSAAVLHQVECRSAETMATGRAPVTASRSAALGLAGQREARSPNPWMIPSPSDSAMASSCAAISARISSGRAVWETFRRREANAH